MTFKRDTMYSLHPIMYGYGKFTEQILMVDLGMTVALTLEMSIQGFLN